MGRAMLESLPKPYVQEPLLESLTKSKEGSIGSKRDSLHLRYQDRLTVNPILTRQLVSFQANKNIPFYRWFKYKEAFSSELVRYLLRIFRASQPDEEVCNVLDPFAGAGTTLTTAADMGCKATGIEIFPVGSALIRARLLAYQVDAQAFENYLKKVRALSFAMPGPATYHFPHLRITKGAFPEETEQALSTYVSFLNTIADSQVRYLFWLACMSILEEVSYTRKDGQYLRWDSRSSRSLNSNFDKGAIHDLGTAITRKLGMMLEDIKGRKKPFPDGSVEIIEGSCLQELPKIEANLFDLVITSPPYANRYDYTRTYALELAFMGSDEAAIKDLRQSLVSCTVENRSKRAQLAREYASRDSESFYLSAVAAFENQESVREVLDILRKAKQHGELNNSNIPNLVENYLFEMNLVIRELARLLKPGGGVFMVNDNVRYHGEEVPIDLILSDFAASSGLDVDQIWVLPTGKGNSSQQMGTHGRSELRKCVYCWSKPPRVKTH
jgi:DNA modification methylase